MRLIDVSITRKRRSHRRVDPVEVVLVTQCHGVITHITNDSIQLDNVMCTFGLRFQSYVSSLHWNSTNHLNRILCQQDIFQSQLWSHGLQCFLLPVKHVLIANACVLPFRLPCDSLVHQALLKSVRQTLVHQAVPDKGSSFSQRRLQLQHVTEVHIIGYEKNQNAISYPLRHWKKTKLINNKDGTWLRIEIFREHRIELNYSLERGFVLTLRVSPQSTADGKMQQNGQIKEHMGSRCHVGANQ